MKHLFNARLILTAVRKWHYLFWIVLPLLGVILLTKGLTAVENDLSLPISVIDYDQSVYSERLTASLETEDFIRLVDYSEEEAYQALEKHQLEAVFVIEEGYADQIERGKRGRLITGYQTEFAFTYPLIKEIITSIIQEDLSRTKAYDAYERLNRAYQEKPQLSYEAFLEESLLKTEEEGLLTTELIYSNEKKTGEKTLINSFDIWLILSFLATLFLFDWVVLESGQGFKNRLLLSQWSVLSYFLFGFIFITTLTLLSDLLFYLTHEMTQSLSVYFNYRLIINLSVFLLASFFTKKESYYKWLLIFFLLFSLFSGLIIPIDRLLLATGFFSLLHPVYLLKANESALYLLGLLIVLLALRFVRGGFLHARS